MHHFYKNIEKLLSRLIVSSLFDNNLKIIELILFCNEIKLFIMNSIIIYLNI